MKQKLASQFCIIKNAISLTLSGTQMPSLANNEPSILSIYVLKIPKSVKLPYSLKLYKTCILFNFALSDLHKPVVKNRIQHMLIYIIFIDVNYLFLNIFKFSYFYRFNPIIFHHHLCLAYAFQADIVFNMYQRNVFGGLFDL